MRVERASGRTVVLIEVSRAVLRTGLPFDTPPLKGLTVASEVNNC
jgi:hypothetical protein